MTAHTTTQQPNREPEPAVDQAQKPASAGMFARVSLTQLTLFVLVLIFLWQWLDAHREISAMQQQLAAKIAEMDGNGKARQIMLEQDQEQVRELFAKVTTLETNYAETQNQQASLKALYNELSANRDKTVLAEIEQLLLIAEQQLQLSGNVKAALIAMQSADDRLKRLNRVTLNGLRKTLGADMDKLRALPNVDITGINGQLNNLISAVDQLQLVYQQHVANEDDTRAVPPKGETSWQKLLREIWQEMKQLVRIENTGKAEIPLLPPDQEFYLRENLKLHLLAARLDLLSRDESGFRQELKTAQTWTERYFDGKTTRSARMLDELKKLAASKINVELPDISSSLQMIRNYRLSRANEPKAGPAGPTKAE